MGGGAWPFLVGGMICLLNCDNERDLNLLTSHVNSKFMADFLEGLCETITRKIKAKTGL